MRVFAQNLTLPGGTIQGAIPASSNLNTLGDLIGKLIPYFILFAGIGMLLMLIWGGFQLLTGGSDPKQLEMGRKRITYSIVGFLVVFLAYWLVQAFAIMFGLSEFACVFGSIGNLTCKTSFP